MVHGKREKRKEKRVSGPKLGRPKRMECVEEKRFSSTDEVYRTFGVAKRRYALGLLRKAQYNKPDSDGSDYAGDEPKASTENESLFFVFFALASGGFIELA